MSKCRKCDKCDKLSTTTTCLDCLITKCSTFGCKQLILKPGGDLIHCKACYEKPQEKWKKQECKISEPLISSPNQKKCLLCEKEQQTYTKYCVDCAKCSQCGGQATWSPLCDKCRCSYASCMKPRKKEGEYPHLCIECCEIKKRGEIMCWQCSKEKKYGTADYCQKCLRNPVLYKMCRDQQYQDLTI